MADFDEKDKDQKDALTEDQKESDYEDVCFICRRPESKAGKMFKLPNNICVCNDCMHKTMDTVSQFDYQGMLDPNFMNSLNQDMSKKGFPNIRFLNIADLQGEGGIPNKQKIKKKKPKEEIIIMEKKKSYGVLIAGAILLILGIVLAVITHNNSYQESVAYGSQLSDVKAQLEEVEASIEAVTGGTADGDLDALNAQKDELAASKSTLSDQKLSAERPYSYSLVLVFFAILLTAKGLYNAIAGVIPAQKADVKKLAQAGLLAALCQIFSQHKRVVSSVRQQ